MDELRAKLAAATGRALPAAAPAEAPRGVPATGLLAEGAWRSGPWAERLAELLRVTPGAPRIGHTPSLPNQVQVTDQLAAKLKRDGRKRERADLLSLRKAFLASRESAGWTALKARFAELSMSDKAYRRLKAEGVDPVAALGRLAKADPEALASMGAARLHALLVG